jgi:putative transposase
MLVMDLFARKIAGLSMTIILVEDPTVISTLIMALGKRPVNPNELIYHYDRGSNIPMKSSGNCSKNIAFSK